MTELLTAAQMRAVEQAAIASGKVTGLELMERAARGVVDALFAEWPELAKPPHRAAVLCGPGNNGGDGFVVARLLKESGWEVEVFLYCDPGRMPPDARVNYDRWLGMGTVLPYDAPTLLAAGDRAVSAGAASWIIVDALYGIGQRAPMDAASKPVNALIDATFERGAAPAPVFVSVDIPTGYDADTGEVLAQRPIPTDLIVTFHARKLLHAMPHMSDATCVVVDIGL